MNPREEYLYNGFLSVLPFEPTPCQDRMLRMCAQLCTGDEAGDILVVDGYAGTGKTTAIAAVVQILRSIRTPVVLLAPTGRSAKVLSSYAAAPAFTIHKHIYRQKSFGEDGGAFSLGFNPNRNTLFVVDEVSLIGIDPGQEGSPFGSGDLLSDLVSFVRSNTGNRLVLLGDSAQLPPVGHDRSPALDKDYMRYKVGGVSWCTLETVVRQEHDSGILVNATRVRGMITACPRYGEQTFGFGEIGLDVGGYPDIRSINGGELIDELSAAYNRWGEDGTIVLCRSNKRALVYNLGIRSRVLYQEDELVRGDNLMVVRNCYNFATDLPRPGDPGYEDAPEVSQIGYIANGDICKLVRISRHEQRYGLHFARAVLSFPDYGGEEVHSVVCLDTLASQGASLAREQQDALFRGVLEDYGDIPDKRERYKAVRQDPFYNALQLKYALAVTGHKSQGGQWDCVFIDNPFWQEEASLDDLKWLYTALTRAVREVYLVNFKDEIFS